MVFGNFESGSATFVASINSCQSAVVAFDFNFAFRLMFAFSFGNDKIKIFGLAVAVFDRKFAVCNLNAGDGNFVIAGNQTYGSGYYAAYDEQKGKTFCQ